MTGEQLELFPNTKPALHPRVRPEQRAAVMGEFKDWCKNCGHYSGTKLAESFMRIVNNMMGVGDGQNT